MEIQKSNSGAMFTPEQVNLIKSQIAPKATDDELKLFLQLCRKTGLDPFSRQIYAIHRNTRDANGNYVSKMSIQVAIDGFRAIAERSGDYAGQDEPVFETDDKGNLVCCKITVFRFRGDTRYPAAVGVAYWDEYKQTDFKGNLSPMWAKMPRIMLSKCAEALALRKAYPNELGGLYTTEEMQQASKGPSEDEKEELIASLIDLDMDDETRSKAMGTIRACSDFNQFLKIKERLESYRPVQEGEIVEEKPLEIADKMLRKLSKTKPSPEVIKQINKKLKEI